MQPNQGGIIGLLIKTGLAKSEADANKVMLIVVAVSVLVIGFILLGGNGDEIPPEEDPAYLIEQNPVL